MVDEISRTVRKHVFSLGVRLLFSLPNAGLRRIFGEPPEAARGLMPDAWALACLARLMERADTEPELERLETDAFAWAASDRLVVKVDTEDLDLGTPGSPLPARLYRPEAAPGTGPLLVFFHGGGWVVGSLDSHDFSCRRLADAAGIRILAVDYALAPERPFPAAPDDARRAWEAVTADPARFGAAPGQVAVGGDSAGANLAAVLCQDLRRDGQPQPLFQFLIYPVAEIRSERDSASLFAEGYYLTRERVHWYEDHYLPGGPTDDPRAAPLKADDLSGLAPAYVCTALADPLRDEGEAYARRLMKAGVETRLDRFPLVHAWFNQTFTRSARTAHRIVAARVGDLFGQAGSAPAEADAARDRTSERP
jgi:acetyl esterase